MEMQNIKKFKIRKFTKVFSEIKYTVSVDLLSQEFTIRRTKESYFVNEQYYDLPDSYEALISLLNKFPAKITGDCEHKTTDADIWYKVTYFDANDKKHETLFTGKEENSIWFLILNWIKDNYSWVEDVPDF